MVYHSKDELSVTYHEDRDLAKKNKNCFCNNLDLRE